MLLLLIVICWLFKASSSQISSSGNTTAVYGGAAHYHCASTDATGVRQVTWQRLFTDHSVENLATFSPRFGQQVNEPYRGKVAFTEATLSSTAITVRNVTWQDESCYVCSFNVFPDGSRGRQTCLTVQGISEVNTSAQIHEPDGEVVLRCSATGKPAPTVEWELPPGESYSPPEQTQTASNADRTFTSSSSVTLKLRPHWDGHVDCVLNRGRPGQRTERIPVVLQQSESEEGTGSSHVGVVWSVSVVLLVVICTAATAAFLRSRRLECKTRNDGVV